MDPLAPAHHCHSNPLSPALAVADAAATGSERGRSEINGVSGWNLHGFGVAALGREERGRAPHGRGCPLGKVGDAGGEDREQEVQRLVRGWGS